MDDQVLQQQPVEQTQQQPEQVQAQPAVQTEHEINWRRMREERDAAIARARELEELTKAKLTQAQPEQSEDENELVERRHLKKYDETIRKQQEIIDKTNKELEQIRNSSIEHQLRTAHPDIDKVVNQENLEKLKQLKPALYNSVVSNTNLRDQLESAYELINSYVQPNKFQEQDKRIDENKTKPKTSAFTTPQVSESPLAMAGEYDRRVLSEERKEQLWKEMRRVQGY